VTFHVGRGIDDQEALLQKDERKTKKQLINELAAMRRRIAELEAAGAEGGQAKEVPQQYAGRLRVLCTIAEATLAAWSPEEVAQVALCHIRQLIPCPAAAAVVTFAADFQEAALLAVHADGETSLKGGMHLPPKEVGDTQSLQQGRVIVVHDSLTSADPSPAIRALHPAGVRSWVVAPLIVQGELIGALALAAESPRAFTPQLVETIQEVAGLIAVALYQARLRAVLEAERQQLEAAVKHLPEGILLLDSERRIVLANPVAESYLSVLTDASVGEVLTCLAEWPVEEVLQTPLVEGSWRELEIAGPPRQLFGVATRHVRMESQVGGWVLLIWDVTEERAARQRAQQQERLAAVGRLAGGIAHDFNNLLTTIILYAQMPLRKPDLPSDVTQPLETILSESQQAAELVKQILDFSRSSPVETQPIDLRAFIEEKVEILKRTMRENIRLLVEVGPDEYVVNADPIRIQQVLMNLALNAQDAMPEGGDLRIGLSSVETGERPPVAEMPAGEWVRLTISDTGTGISPDAMPHIFEPFFTTKLKGEGAGLGLAQVYGIVKQHKGHIDVKTDLGRGTSFHIYLPTGRTEDTETALREEMPLLRGQGQTILLVEDEERVRESARDTLASLGYLVLTAVDGQEALEIYRSVEEVDLVITNRVMARMGGQELIRELRRASPRLKALLITGYPLTDDHLRKLRAERIHVVQKPFNSSTLAQMVRQVLEAGDNHRARSYPRSP
jgi:two-component system cell cycle sensor histidine kinase/response regulator CckA